MAKQAKYNWQAKESVSVDALKQFQEATGASLPFATLCLQRGIDTKEKLEVFKKTSLDDLYDPFLMYDMQKGVDRIKYAIENGEKILVYGDYDADGITSTSILCEAIETLGGEVQYYLPNRFIDGYGPNVAVFQYMIDVEQVNLIVTCDNGVAGHEAIALAMSKDVDVIVTDHHEMPAELPNAYAIIHPRHPKGNYPFGELSGAGVAFKVACALLEDLPMESLDLAAIGTVADVMPLVDENRILVTHGLSILKQTQRIGLQKLLEQASVDLDNVTVDTIGFVIGPRLNAIGRLDDATPGVELMLTFDDEQADELVGHIVTKNKQRQDIVSQIVEQVNEQITDYSGNMILLADDKWHAGVLGIVASQVVEKTGKPTILLQIDTEKGVAKGSGRSVHGVNLYDVLTQVKDLLVTFGGHDMAAGLTVSTENITALKNTLNQLVPQLEKAPRFYDLELPSQAITVDLLHELKALQPFGSGNDKPIIQLTAETLNQVKWIGDKQQHVKGRIGNLDIISFNASEQKTHLIEGTTLTAWISPSLNEWNGIEKAQGQLLDTQIDTIQFFDKRSSKIKPEDVAIANATYVFFNTKYYDFFKDKLPSSSVAILYDTVQEGVVEQLVLFDCPDNMEQLTLVLSRLHFDNIHVMCHTKTPVYLTGSPTRQQFSQVFKVLAGVKEIVIKDKIDALAKSLGFQKDLIILIIQVFFELNFVTIEDGVLRYVGANDKVDLFQSKTLVQYEQKCHIQRELLFQTFANVETLLQSCQNKE